MITNTKSNFQVINLENKSDWSPASFLQRDSVFIWPTELDLVRLQQIAKIVKPCGYSIEPTAVVLPSAIDTNSGTIKNLSDKSEQVFFDWERDGLAVNDILVSARGALLLTPTMTNILFSSRFIALRCKDEKIAVWLWAVLNTPSGRFLLDQVFRVDGPIVNDRNRQHRVGALMEAKVPTRAPEKEMPFLELAKINSQLKHQLTISRDVRSSWFRKAAIAQTDNWISLTKMQDPSLWGQLTPITDLIGEVIVGKSANRTSAEELNNPIPFVGFKFLRNPQPSEVEYVEGVERQSVGLPGDILIGFSFNKLFVFPLTFSCAIGPWVFALRLKDLKQSDYVQSALRSQVVQDQLSFFQTGTVVGTIKKSDVEKLRLPDVGETALRQNDDLESLATRLDKILWN